MIYFRIKDLRVDRDLSQAVVAESVGLYTTTYQRYERGERELPFDIAIALAKFYNVSLDYLAGLTNVCRTLDGSPSRFGKNFRINQKGNITNNF